MLSYLNIKLFIELIFKARPQSLLRYSAFIQPHCGYNDFAEVTLKKHSSRGVLRKKCPENMQQISRRTPMPKCDFNKFVLQLY